MRLIKVNTNKRKGIVLIICLILLLALTGIGMTVATITVNESRAAKYRAAKAEAVQKSKDVALYAIHKFNMEYPPSQIECTPPTGYTLVDSYPVDYGRCANEGYSCVKRLDSDVYYGAHSSYHRIYRGSIENTTFTCNNNLLGGDPIGGEVKACYVDQSPPISSYPAGYTKCADEGQICTKRTGSDVYYGAEGKYLKIFRDTVGNSFTCNSNLAGDPIDRVLKACYVDQSVPTGIVELSTSQTQETIWNSVPSNSDIVYKGRTDTATTSWWNSYGTATFVLFP